MTGDRCSSRMRTAADHQRHCRNSFRRTTLQNTRTQGQRDLQRWHKTADRRDGSQAAAIRQCAISHHQTRRPEIRRDGGDDSPNRQPRRTRNNLQGKAQQVRATARFHSRRQHSNHRNGQASTCQGYGNSPNTLIILL